VLASACATSSGAPGVVPGDPLHSDPTRLRQYVWLMQLDVQRVHQGLEPATPALRAWIREADRTIRANNEVYGIPADAEEDLPWITRLWHSFSRIFTAR